MITYQEEKFGDFLEEMRPILEDHYDELSVSKQFPLNPRYDQYLVLQEQGYLCCITARDEGKLVGYILYLMVRHLHYNDCLTAQDDVYFVQKEYRKGRVGLRLFQNGEKYLKKLGVNRIILTCKLHLDHSRLFEFMGYRNIEKVYDKIL